MLFSILATALCTLQFAACEYSMRDTNTSSLVKRHVKNFVSNKDHTELLNEAKSFENIHEDSIFGSVTPFTRTTTVKNNNELADIKALLSKLTEKIGNLEKTNSRSTDVLSSEPYYYTPTTYVEIRKRKASQPPLHNIEKRQRWGDWTEWSPCSVSCGRGRKIRWRHCLDVCEDAETEMEEKLCQLPACGPGKLFGVIQL